MKILKLLLVSFFICNVSIAADKPIGYFGWHATGTFHQMGENAGYWTGEFSGSFKSDEGDSGMFHKMSVRCPAWQKFNFVKGTSYAEGVCYGKDLEGNEVYFDWAGSEQKLGQPGKGTFSYTGGTGKYEGLSGEGGFFIGHTVTNWKDGSASGYATWNR